MDLIISIGGGWSLDLLLLGLSSIYLYYTWHVSHHRDYVCVEDVFKQNKRIEEKLNKIESLIVSNFQDSDD